MVLNADWAYAGSWDTNYVHACTPRTYNTYPTDRTVYSDSMLRAFNVLVEAWDRKRPYESELGSDTGVLKVSGPGDGHVPRNIRLALLMVDLVEPYVQWTHITTSVTPRRRMRGSARRDARRLAEDTAPWQAAGSTGPVILDVAVRLVRSLAQSWR